MSLTDWLNFLFCILWIANFVIGIIILRSNKKLLRSNQSCMIESNNNQMDLLLSIENVKRYIEEDDRVINHQTEILRESLEALTETVTELRMEIAVLRGMNGGAIPMPYKGAKRGPKPKQVIEQED
jgi:histone H3/H4